MINLKYFELAVLILFLLPACLYLILNQKRKPIRYKVYGIVISGGTLGWLGLILTLSVLAGYFGLI
jgi:hypothetical protein